MAVDPLANSVEAFSAPIESMIIALGQGIALAQQSLDTNSIKTQETIDSDPLLSQYGLQATWYQFPTVDMQLKISLSITQDQTSSSYKLFAQPLSASFQNHFNYDATAATQINVTLVPVPPPKTANQVNSPPSMTQAAVTTVALASGAGLITAKNAAGATVDAAGNVYVMQVNFNATSRTWYVVQYAPSNPAISAIVVAVDDATQTARVITPAA